MHFVQKKVLKYFELLIVLILSNETFMKSPVYCNLKKVNLEV